MSVTPAIISSGVLYRRCGPWPGSHSGAGARRALEHADYRFVEYSAILSFRLPKRVLVSLASADIGPTPAIPEIKPSASRAAPLSEAVA